MTLMILKFTSQSIFGDFSLKNSEIPRITSTFYIFHVQHFLDTTGSFMFYQKSINRAKKYFSTLFKFLTSKSEHKK